MNKHDSERISGLLEVAGFLPASSANDADIIIVNTCAVRENAVKRLKGYVRSLGKPKKRGAVIGIAGCVAQIEKERLLKEIPFVDFVFGPDEIDDLLTFVSEAINGRRTVATEFDTRFFASELPSKRETPHHAWLLITKGCDNFCTYCVVPYARGKMVSRKREDIIEEAKKLFDSGVLDVTLIGQNVNAYGKDIYGKTHFINILEKIADIGFRKVSFATSHPADFKDELIDLMASRENISKQLHLPVQSGSNRVLKRMNRGYTRERYLEIVEKVRKIPNLSLTTDIIVGFPGETENDFNETIELIEIASFDQVFTFMFSPRPFTEASKYKDQIPEEIKKERFKILTEKVKEVNLKQNLKLVGNAIDAIIEGKSKTRGFIQARTEAGKIVLFKNGYHRIGEKVRVLIKEAGPHHLVGELIKD